VKLWGLPAGSGAGSPVACVAEAQLLSLMPAKGLCYHAWVRITLLYCWHRSEHSDRFNCCQSAI